MTDGADEQSSLLNKQQRKKARRKQKKQNERAAHRNLDDVTGEAIAQALELAPSVAEAVTGQTRHQALDVALASVSEAEFVRKRVNDALNVDEWLSEITVSIWRKDEDGGAALSATGTETGIELRLSQNR